MSIKRLAKCFILLFSSYQSLYAEPQSLPIINGDDATSGSFPWMASIFLTEAEPSSLNGGHFCGAVLIAPRYALTAAHCAAVVADDPERFSLAFNLTDLSDPVAPRRKIIGVVQHPQFDPATLKHDVALLKLDQPVNIPFPQLRESRSTESVQGDISLSIMGWGMTHPIYPVLPTILQTAIIPAHSDQLCTETIGRYFDPATMMCAGILSSDPDIIDGVDTCNGDSGSPIVLENNGTFSVVGLTSWGYRCASHEFYGVYAEVAPHREWILSYPQIPPRVSGPAATLEYSVPLDGDELPLEESVRCIAPKFSGDDLQISYQWSFYDWNSFSDGEIVGATTDQLFIDSSLVGKSIYCKVLAKNSAGEDLSESELSPIVVNRTVVQQTPHSSYDKVAPKIDNLKIACRARTCTAIAKVSDQAPSGGLKGVSSSYELSARRCTKQNGCISSKSIGLLNFYISRKSWISKFTIPRRYGTLRVFAIAKDNAGNSSKATIRRLKLIR